MYVPAGIPAAPESPLTTAVHGLFAPAMEPTTGLPAIGIGQKSILVENGRLGAAGSIGITFKLTVKI